jgi:hypothetical protein
MADAGLSNAQFRHAEKAWLAPANMVFGEFTTGS